MEQLKRSIQASLRREGIDADVIGRQKHLYSIYRKMKTQHKSFVDIMDVFGFRIVVDRVDTCYRALGVVHNLYKPVLSRFKDYIAIPKANGYQSLHTALVGMHGVPIEVQIRTRQMDTLAEKGIAGHWLYKNDLAAEGSHVRSPAMGSRATRSPTARRQLPRVHREPEDRPVSGRGLCLYRPRGEIMELPRGACPIDFAYSIHTDIGNHLRRLPDRPQPGTSFRPPRVGPNR